jgi:tRNA (cytidine/uridine-2'-O-)-methyltransferase
LHRRWNLSSLAAASRTECRKPWRRFREPGRIIVRIALYRPDIPQNTGTILRLAACFGVAVDVVGPAGFDLSDRALRRAGLDYAEHAALVRHVSWERFLADRPGGRLVLLTTAAETRHCDFLFRPDDVLLFGRESGGVPPAVHGAADARLRIPLRAGRRSLNLAVACGIALAEALRQTGGFEPGAAEAGQLLSPR